MIKEFYVVYILRGFFCRSIGCDLEKKKSESILHHLKINLSTRQFKRNLTISTVSSYLHFNPGVLL